MKKYRFLMILLLLFSFTLAHGNLPPPNTETTIYIVKDGDSLWHITDRFYSNPLLWPRLWEINPYIDDPDLIYPGDIVSLYSDSLVKFEPKTRTDGLTKIDPPPPVFYFSPGGSEGFIHPDEWAHMGSIITAEPPRILYSKGDIVYINIGSKDRARIGDIFTIYKSSKEVRHPYSGKRIGYKVAVLGELEILDVIGKKKSIAKIVDSRREITKGSRIRPVETFVKEVSIKRGSGELDGVIVATKNSTALSGSGDVIYIDVGREHNVSPGNTMSIFSLPRKSIDPDTGRKITIPGTNIGKVILLNVGEETSAGIVVKSSRQIEVGDIVTLDI
ncbi:MAG: LysM peptidoglycan-binding domain-containing protein [Candidatus Dadabacteria bacterium]|nr:LysM peptidoglycan-binding domain-containing protein [Candidatus Dadabacteria bacterium]NIQ14180.1 LysM peptidoglycan-binding domain-containing protein [Candidatus Dadabacteria bacterium]